MSRPKPARTESGKPDGAASLIQISLRRNELSRRAAATARAISQIQTKTPRSRNARCPGANLPLRARLSARRGEPHQEGARCRVEQAGGADNNRPHRPNNAGTGAAIRLPPPSHPWYVFIGQKSYLKINRTRGALFGLRNPAGPVARPVPVARPPAAIGTAHQESPVKAGGNAILCIDGREQRPHRK